MDKRSKGQKDKRTKEQNIYKYIPDNFAHCDMQASSFAATYTNITIQELPSSSTGFTHRSQAQNIEKLNISFHCSSNMGLTSRPSPPKGQKCKRLRGQKDKGTKGQKDKRVEEKKGKRAK